MAGMEVVSRYWLEEAVNSFGSVDLKNKFFFVLFCFYQ